MQHTEYNIDTQITLLYFLLKRFYCLRCVYDIIMEFLKNADIRNLDYISATIPKNCNRLQRITERDDRLGYTYDFETMRKTTAYRNHIKNSKIETREVFEWETLSPENIQRTLPMNILTRLDKNQLTRSTDSSKHEETNKPEVNPDS